MMTHKYRFPAFGGFDGEEEKQKYIDILQKNLKDSPDCLGAWCVCSVEGDVLDKVTLEEDGNNKISSITLHMYPKIWDGCEGDLKDCVTDCIKATSEEHWMGRPIGITIEGDVEYLGLWADNTKPTYKYQFPASGKVTDAPTFTATKLEGHLNEGYDCLGAYCMFEDPKTLDHVSFDIDKDGNVTAVNIHTDTELWDGNDNDFRDCVETNLAKVTDAIKITGDVKALGLEGVAPETLYHIAEKEELEKIMEEGLVPDMGKNSYKNMEDYVYLSSEKDLAPWLSVLKHVDDPAIIEVDTKNLAGIEQGRMFTDRDFIPNGYSEYRTQNMIPPSALMVRNLSQDDEFSQRLCDNMLEQLNCADPKKADEWKEVMTGMDRLEQMGVISNVQKRGWVTVREGTLVVEKAQAEQPLQTPDTPEEGLPWDEEKVELPWDDEDAFTKAVGTIPEDSTDLTNTSR